MRFLAVVLVVVMVFGGMLGLVLQQRAFESPRLSAPVAAAPQQRVPTNAPPTTPQPTPPSTVSTTPTPTLTPEPIPTSLQTGTPQAKKPESLTRVNEASYVQISITPVSLKDDRGMISFDVSMNTHSVDLSRYKIEKLTRLVIDGQSPIVDGFQWEAKLDDSHHRSGVLKLPATDAQGKERITSETQTMTIEISGIAGNGVRSFSWTAPALLLK